jgi:WD40 repeat protein
VPLPGGDSVTTASSDSKLNVFTVSTGALEHEIDAHERDIGCCTRDALGGDVIVSGGVAVSPRPTAARRGCSH